jgi:hypothetical protein
MRIGCDLDGVLADLHRAFAAAALRRYPHLDATVVAAPEVGASPPPNEDGENAETGEGADRSEVPAPPPGVDGRALPLSRSQLDQTWTDLCATTDFWETLHEIESGAIARLATLAETLRWDVIFLTSRPRSAGSTVQRQSQRWLETKGFRSPSLFVVQGSRGKIAEALALDVVIDDRAESCLDVVLESKARAILIWRGTAASVPASAKRLGIGVVPTVGGCLDLLVEAGRAAETPLDLMQRLRRLLGLGPRTAPKD